MSKLRKDQFLRKYNLTEAEFSRTNLKWAELLKIYEDHSKNQKALGIISNYIFEILTELDTVHSIRKRIKDPEHLLEKIIRKSIDKPELRITLENYPEIITDLIGVRVLHLYKDDWLEIHNKILNTWTTVEKPTANIRKGDNEEVYLVNGCEIREHKYGYRSVHYLIEFPCTKDSKKIVEIQVRTLFEEAWSEIDHKIRYPYDLDNPILAGYLVVFNGLSGSADQMGSFIKILKQELDLRDQQMKEKDDLIKQLKEEISKSKLDKQDKERITKSLNKIYLSNFDTSNLTKTIAKSLITSNVLNIDPSIFKISYNIANTLKKIGDKNSNLTIIEPEKENINSENATSNKDEKEVIVKEVKEEN